MPDVIAVQETWFEDKLVRLYSIDGYEAVHCCRYDGYGGTSVYINKQLKYSVLAARSLHFLEFITISLQDIRINNKPLVITSLYRSQKCSLEKFQTSIGNLLLEIQSFSSVIVGDFNIDLTGMEFSSQHIIDKFSEFNFKSNHNLVTRPESNSCIDGVFNNFPEEININSIETGLSDHNLIFCGLQINSQCNEYLVTKTYKIDYNKLGSFIDDNLQTEIMGDSQHLCHRLVNTLSLASDHSTSTNLKKVNMRHKITPWMSEALIAIIDFKNKLLKARRKDKQNASIADRLKRISKIIKNCSKILINDYYEYNISKFSSDPKKTWNFINKQLGKNNKSSKDLVTSSGSVITKDEEKATAFNNFFYEMVQNIRHSIPQYSDDNINIFGSLVQVSSCFSLRAIDQTHVENIVNNLVICKSPGFDNITPKMLLVRKNTTSLIIAQIFNKMIEEGKYPHVLKTHKIMPIPKSFGASKIESFRPISILSTIDKVLEKIIYEQLSSYLEEHNILFDRQYGFKKGTGTEEAVINVVEYVCKGLDDGYKGVAGLFLDLSKAFDLVDHEILCKKLRIIGLSQNAVTLFADYLKERKQFVQINDAKSDVVNVLCGVPQGSVLGPLLFKIYIDDLKNINLNGQLYMYADDICLFYKYKYEKVLQTQIEYDAAILSEYFRINKLLMNGEKTKFIRFKPHICRDQPLMKIHVDGNLICESENVKYLGVNLSHNLLWDNQINNIKTKICSGIGILYKFKNKFNTKTKLLLYQSLVHSHLTYLPIIYGCKKSTSLKTLQSAQNKALKIVFNLPIRFHTINLYQMYAKTILPIRGLYKQQLLIYVFKCLKGVGSHTISFPQNISITRQSRNLNIVRCRLELTKQRIGFSGPSEYNRLPESLKNLSVLSTFKNKLKEHLLESLEILLTF